MNGKHTYGMQYVSRKTGLNPHTIRVWEKRYRAVVPERTNTGHRLFTNADIERLELLRHATLSGHSIGHTARLPTKDLRALFQARSHPEYEALLEPYQSDDASTEKLVHEATHSLDSFDQVRLEKVLHQAATTLSSRHLIEKFLAPFLEKQGMLWNEGNLKIAQEHFSSSIIRGFLSHMHRRPPAFPTEQTLLVATPAGQHHEFGAMFASVEAVSRGWCALYLGPNLPAEEIAAAAVSGRVRAVALSIMHLADDARLDNELRLLRRCLPEDIPIVVGGRSASAYRQSLDASGATIAEDMESLSRFLSSIPKTSSGFNNRMP